MTQMEGVGTAAYFNKKFVVINVTNRSRRM